MGTDIHMIAQVKRDGRFQTVKAELPDDRSYTTFSILADVRNGTGFAGVRTGSGYIPISEPKGLPDDIVVDECGHTPDDGWLGDHSHSYLTLNEMLAYWERSRNLTTKRTGVVPLEVFKKWDGSQPDGWSGAVSGPNIITVSAEQAKKWPTGMYEGKDVYVQIEWEQTYEESTYMTELIEALQKIAKENNFNSNEVRIVFGFDS